MADLHEKCSGKVEKPSFAGKPAAALAIRRIVRRAPDREPPQCVIRPFQSFLAPPFGTITASFGLGSTARPRDFSPPYGYGPAATARGKRSATWPSTAIGTCSPTSG